MMMATVVCHTPDWQAFVVANALRGSKEKTEDIEYVGSFPLPFSALDVKLFMNNLTLMNIFGTKHHNSKITEENDMSNKGNMTSSVQAAQAAQRTAPRH